MNIEHEFRVSVSREQAWDLLTDLAAIAPCMPGAQLTGVEQGVYSGRVKIKVGPVTSEYAGTATFLEQDKTAFRAVISAKGRDPRGAGNASATILAELRPDGDETVVRVATDLKISGKIAQFGSGMIAEVSEKLLGQFVECLEGTLLATQVPHGSRETSAADNNGSRDNRLTEGPRPAADTVTQVGNGRHGPEKEAIDVMQLAGKSVAKRLVPAVIVALLLAVVIHRVVR
jgi:carbon monoxide dehydrogenase subunit G